MLITFRGKSFLLTSMCGEHSIKKTLNWFCILFGDLVEMVRFIELLLGLLAKISLNPFIGFKSS